MPAIGSFTTFSELDALLAGRRPLLTTAEVHALFLGAQTSTSPRLGPQHLLGKIFGEPVELGRSEGEATALIQALFGYWNRLVALREAGTVALAPLDLPAGATREQLREFAQRRHGEMTWYIRGIDAGGDDPLEFGPEGQGILNRIAEADAYLRAYANLLEREAPPDEKALVAGRNDLLGLISAIEGLIADLMDISDDVRRSAMATFRANAGRKTDDGVTIGRPMKVPRNSPCPCGSGKKWKKCCGFLEGAH